MCDLFSNGLFLSSSINDVHEKTHDFIDYLKSIHKFIAAL